MDPDTAAEQRANAVARLRRAASLPRMKDGRRPPVPMHGEAGGVSEGERSQGDEKKDDQTTSTPPEAEAEPENATDPSRSSPNSTPVATTSAMITDVPTNDVDNKQQDVEEPEGEAETAVEVEAEVEAEAAAEAETENERSPTPASGAESSTTKEKGKRRSRSRSRSRGSKDLRAKVRAANEAAAAAAQATLSGDAIDDESPPATINTAQHYFMQLAAAHAQGQTGLLSPLSPFGYGAPSGANNAMSSPMSPAGIPTLQALQTRHLQGGLFRSNSAAARLMAMQKLTGEPLDINAGINGAGTPRAASPLGASQAAGGGRLGLSGLTRNNTVAGGERIAARQQLLRRLHDRIQEKERSDVETTSGAEETGPAPSAVTKGRRRRSRRKSQSHVVDDRDLAASLTPSATPAPAEDLLVPYPPPPSASPGPSGTGMGVQRPFSPFAPLAALTAPLPPSRAPSVPLEKQQQHMQLLQQFHEYQTQQAVQHMQQLEALHRAPDPHLRILRQHTPSPMPTAPQTVPNQRPTPEMQFRRTPDPRTPTPTATTPEPPPVS